MPVNERGVGVGDQTVQKEDDFNYIAKLVSGKVKGFQKITGRPQSFLYIDAFAGNGYNNEVECAGSPLQVIPHLKGLDYEAWLIDNNEKNIDELRGRIGSDSRVFYHFGDCREILTDLTELIPNLYGLLLIDPNGNPYFEMLQKFYNRPITAKIDVCIRLGDTNYKRPARCFGWPDLTDSLKEIKKGYWFIKRPSDGATKWTTIFGTNNNNCRPSMDKGFFDIRSPGGQAILNVMNHTRSDPASDYKSSQRPLSAFGSKS